MHAPEDTGIEPGLELVERPVIRRARMLGRHDRDSLARQRRVNDLVGMHEQEPFADLNRQPLAAALSFGDELDDPFELRVNRARAGGVRPIQVRHARARDAAPRSIDRHFETRGINRLQQIVDGVDFEGLNRVLIVRRHENNVRRRTRVHHVARHFEACQPGHLDIKEDDVGLQSIDGRECLDSVAGLADHLDAANAPEQKAELVARQLFVVDQNGPQVHLTPSPAPRPRARGLPCGRRCPAPGRSSVSAGSVRPKSSAGVR